MTIPFLVRRRRLASASLLAAVASTLAACSDSPPTVPADAAPPWREAVAHAVRASGLTGLVGVEMSGAGADARPVRLLAGPEQAAELARANQLLASAVGPAPGGGTAALARAAAREVGTHADLFQVRPNGSGTPATYTYTTRWGCADQINGYVWEPIAVRVAGWTTEAVEGSGGHVHPASSKPRGTWSATSGVTAGDGVWSSEFKAPVFAGSERLRYMVTGVTRCTGTRTVEETYTIAVPGLVSIGSGPGYILVGQTGTHPGNHFGTPGFNAALRALAQRFLAKYNKNLAYNDMSLITGGRFDVGATWTGAHSEHRFGKNVDLRTRDRTASQLRFIKAEWEALGGTVHDETGTSAPHYHLRY